MSMGKHWMHRLGCLLALTLVSCHTDRNTPKVFQIDCPRPQLDVFGGKVTASVSCDMDWTVQVQDDSWGSITMEDHQVGQFSFSAPFYDGQGTRRNVLLVKAGRSVKQLEVSQTGAELFFSPATVALRETETVTVSFRAPEAWTAEVSGENPWLCVTPAAGEAGLASVEICASEANANLGDREGRVRFLFGDRPLSLVVSQRQKNVILPGGGRAAGIGYEGGLLRVPVQSNVAYTVRVSESWLTHSTTKALNQTEECFQVEPNPSATVRRARLVFSSGSGEDALSESLEVVQTGHDPFLQTRQLGFYGLPGGDILSEDGVSQISRVWHPDGTADFRILFPAQARMCTLWALPTALTPGQSASLKVTVQQQGFTTFVGQYEFLLLDDKDGHLWLKAEEAGVSLLIAKTEEDF